ncbi:Tol-Pal system beta propeller repeat protein TolB [Candidatus Liberibacter americanus]|uniref:TolB protein n=1 Tax=Candidatus Liberibacter americanus str. Sao Paulo TaxID=1261131 RepID=U6B638_9HYPH|nr:Tol-Pal system beta propeller repeat protein TolB [Candidatus Liberibacter americanus]AHA28239.1 tolB protein precursor [Candidatus Liberibacter americanus str. Sao Paulo]EMS36247.1 translocation protein TolB [Candidatus Liberibacter americanus PW_SP]
MRINFYLLLVFISSFFVFPAQALVKINTNNPNYSPISVAVTDFISLDKLGIEFSEVISSDLDRSDLFVRIPKGSFLQKITNPDNKPLFEYWDDLKAQVLVTGRVIKEGSNRLRVEFRLWDVKNRKQVLGKKLFSLPEDWRTVAHTISDHINQIITGYKGSFNTRILFVSENIVSGETKRRLSVMDRDGFNIRYLKSYSNSIFTPHFSPNQQKIAYVSHDSEGLPKIYLMDTRTERQPKIVGNSRGMVFSPSFSPDGSHIIMGVQKDESIDIYTLDYYSNIVKRLTNTLFVNISPSYSPNSSRIVFSSDREGNQQLYVMNSDGSDQHRISLDKESSYFDCVWSPREDLIAFTKFSNGKFSIGVMNSNGSKERIIITDNNIQSPSWSPNGRSLIFVRKNVNELGSKLYSIDLNGRNESMINTPEYASDPHWVSVMG